MPEPKDEVTLIVTTDGATTAAILFTSIVGAPKVNAVREDEHPEDGKLSNEPGTLSMANTGRPNSGSCQFFINTVHNSYLDWFTAGQSKHPVFGRVTEGMDVLKTIETTPTGSGDRPKTPVKMIKVTIHE